MPSPSLQPILALLGQPVDGNPTQFMMEKVFAHHELDWRYLTLEVAPDDLGDAVRGMRAFGFSGGNIAPPHQAAVVEHLDRTGDTAGLVGAVSAVFRDGPALVGEYTDGLGVLEALRTVLDPVGKRAVLLGTGTLARAAGIELVRAGIGSLLVVGREETPAFELADLLHGDLKGEATAGVWGERFALPPETELLVQTEATAEELPLDLDTLRPEVTVLETGVSPPETWLLERARQRGCPVVDGLEVLCRRTALEVHRWTGVAPAPAVLRDAVEEFFFL